MSVTQATDSISAAGRARGGPAEEITAAIVRASVGFIGSTALLVACMIVLAAR